MKKQKPKAKTFAAWKSQFKRLYGVPCLALYEIDVPKNTWQCALYENELKWIFASIRRFLK